MSVYRVYKPKQVERVDGFKKYSGGSKKEDFTKKQKKRNKDEFKKEFCERFGLDESKFQVNLVKMKDRWMVQICHKKSNNCVFHDYEVLCGLLDKKCKLPDVVGANIDREA